MTSTLFLILHSYILLTPAEPVLGLTKISPKERFCSVGSGCYLELKTTQGSVVRSSVLLFLPAMEISGLRILFCFIPVKIESNTSCNKAIQKVNRNATMG